MDNQYLWNTIKIVQSLEDMLFFSLYLSSLPTHYVRRKEGSRGKEGYLVRFLYVVMVVKSCNANKPF